MPVSLSKDIQLKNFAVVIPTYHDLDSAQDKICTRIAHG